MYLVTGGSGFLGAAVLRALSRFGGEKTLAVTKNGGVFDCGAEWLRCDVGSVQGIESLARKIGDEEVSVFWFSAFHAIDKIPSALEEAYAVNVTALERFFNSGVNVKQFFFSSTDCVYGENFNGIPARESDALKPISIYGEQKARAEDIVIAAGHNVLRLPLMFGKSSTPCKPHFYEVSKEKLKNGEKLFMLDGFVRSALDYSAVAETMLLASKASNLPQVLNLCGDKSFSKYELGLLTAENAGADKSLVVKLPISDAARFYTEPRANFGLMDNSLIKETLGIKELTLNPERSL